MNDDGDSNKKTKKPVAATITKTVADILADQTKISDIVADQTRFSNILAEQTKISDLISGQVKFGDDADNHIQSFLTQQDNVQSLANSFGVIDKASLEAGFAIDKYVNQLAAPDYLSLTGAHAASLSDIIKQSGVLSFDLAESPNIDSAFDVLKDYGVVDNQHKMSPSILGLVESRDAINLLESKDFEFKVPLPIRDEQHSLMAESNDIKKEMLQVLIDTSRRTEQLTIESLEQRREIAHGQTKAHWQSVAIGALIAGILGMVGWAIAISLKIGGN